MTSAGALKLHSRTQVQLVRISKVLVSMSSIDVFIGNKKKEYSFSLFIFCLSALVLGNNHPQKCSVKETKSKC